MICFNDWKLCRNMSYLYPSGIRPLPLIHTAQRLQTFAGKWQEQRQWQSLHYIWCQLCKEYMWQHICWNNIRKYVWMRKRNLCIFDSSKSYTQHSAMPIADAIHASASTHELHDILLLLAITNMCLQFYTINPVNWFAPAEQSVRLCPLYCSTE